MGSGITSASCLVSPFGASTNDLIPVAVESIGIIELDQMSRILVEERRDVELYDGDSFSYSSIVTTLREFETIHEIPKALQLNISGRNKDGVTLMSVLIVIFSNDCNASPVFDEGQIAAWVTFSRVSDPVSDLCPPFSPSTITSSQRTQRPSHLPSPTPSRLPIILPTPKPSRNEPTQPMFIVVNGPTQPPDSSGLLPDNIETPMNDPFEAQNPSFRPSKMPQNSQVPTVLSTWSKTPTKSQRPTIVSSPTRSKPPSASRVPEPSVDIMSMSMSMLYGISDDFEYRKAWESEYEAKDDYPKNQ